MALKTGLEGKPWWHGLVAGLAVGGVFYGLLHWQILVPKQDQIRGQETHLAELQQKILEGRAAELQLPEFRRQVQELELELDKLLRILPARRNTPDLLRRIRALAEQGDFTLKRFTPGQLSDKDFYSEWPIEVEVEGGYHNLALFFDRISRFSRIINVENLKIDAFQGKGPHTIHSTFTAKTFVYKEPEPGPPAETASPAAAAAAGGPPRGPSDPDAPAGGPLTKPSAGGSDQ